MTSVRDYYRQNVTWVGSLDRRLAAIADIVVARGPGRTLDLGCGEGVLLGSLSVRLPTGSHLVGLDVVPPPDGAPWRGVVGDIWGGV